MSGLAVDQRVMFCGTARRVAYAVSGRGPAIVCPAFWVSHVEHDWRNEALRRFYAALGAGRTLVRYDRPGAGLSDRTCDDSTLETEVADLEAVVDALGEERVTLFGISCAGPPAIAYAARHPERVERLVLYGTYASGAEVAKPEVRAALLGLVRAHWGLGSRALVDIFAPDISAEEAKVLAVQQRTAASAEAAARLLALAQSMDVGGLVAQVRAPTLVLHRRSDRAVPFERGRALAAALPGAEFVPLEGSIHIPWLGDPAPLLAATRRFLGEPAEGASPPLDRPGASGAQDGMLVRRGDVWEARFGAKTALLKHSKGIADLAVLLARPGEEVPAAELAGSVRSSASRAPGAEAVLDARAVAEIRARLAEIEEGLVLAKARADAATAEQLAAEKDALIDEVRAATGLRGRPRALGDPAEKARKAVTARIRDAIAAIAAAHPALGAHLERSVRTGLQCSYAPAADRQIASGGARAQE